MSHFIFSYVGNKYKEFKILEEDLNFDDIDKIIEPICGTSAFSFHVWLKYKDKLNCFKNIIMIINLYLY